MTHWDPPAWDPPVVGGDRTPTPETTASTSGATPRLPPTDTQRPIHAVPTQRLGAPRPVPLVRATEQPPRRVPAWIWAGAACVAVAGAFAIGGAGNGAGGDADQRAQLTPGGVIATDAQPTEPAEPAETTIVVPPSTAPPTAAATPTSAPESTTAPETTTAPEPERPPEPTTAPTPAPTPAPTLPPAPATTTVAVQPLLPQPNCHPSYTPCVPIDEDVDCAGGSGNGPSYATGPITVIGPDEYGLDRDGDGIACEP